MNAADKGADNRFYIKTLGCKVNQYESQAIRELLLKAGFKECLSKETADVYIINTCTVTHKAEAESRYWAGVFHKANPGARIVITGCCAERDEGLFSTIPGIANVIKNKDKSKIAEILSNTPNSLLTPPCPSRPAGQATPNHFLRITDFKNHSKAFIKIQDGCTNFCSYCKVPYVRGPLMSKPINDVVEEISILAAKGFKEIVLTGICLGAWGIDLQEKQSITDVLKVLNDLPGDFRIRLSSIEPKYVTDELIDIIAQNKRFCRHLHIPIQSGDDEILAKMNRPYTSRQIKDIVIKIRKRIEGVGVTTDMMIGFPGESDENFRNSVNLIKDIMPVKTHIFPFSRREGTAAFAMDKDIPQEVMKIRFQQMQTAAIAASYLFREKLVNKTLDVLVETKREKYSGRLSGYSDNYVRIMFDGPDTIMKTIAPVKITDSNLTCTLGAIDPFFS